MEGVEDVDLSGDEPEPEQAVPENETERNAGLYHSSAEGI